MGIKIHTKNNFVKMRAAAGRLAAEVLDFVTEYVQLGVTTNHLNDLCHEFIVSNGAMPATLNYQGGSIVPFTKSICTSINHVVCHGIPSDRKLKNGDVMMIGIEKIKPGATLGDIGYSIQKYAEKHNYSVVRDYSGHGIGKVFHDEPAILHYGQPGADAVLEEGMFFTVEPMLNAGSHSTILSKLDHWTVTTRDKSLSAQFEHTIGVTNDGFEIIYKISPKNFLCPPCK